MPLSKADNAKLVKLIVLASGSNVDGEALNALRLANALADKGDMSLLEALRGAGTQVLDLRRMQQLDEEAYERGKEAGRKEAQLGLGAAAQYAAQAADIPVWAGPLPWNQTARHAGRTWQQVAREVIVYDQQTGILRDKERIFVHDILARGFPTLTPKQEPYLQSLARKCNVLW